MSDSRTWLAFPPNDPEVARRFEASADPGHGSQADAGQPESEGVSNGTHRVRVSLPRGTSPEIVREIREMARIHAPRAFARLVELMASPSGPTAISAAKAVLGVAGVPLQAPTAHAHAHAHAALPPSLSVADLLAAVRGESKPLESLPSPSGRTPDATVERTTEEDEA